MRVSWLIPVRDGGAWLSEAVDSAVAQCSAGDEVIVVDDGSRDGAVDALADTPFLHRIRQAPQGIVAALERGRSAASGELIARLDADDVALPGRIDAQRTMFLAEPGLGAAGGRARIHRDGEAVPGGMQRYVAWLNELQDLHASRLVESPLFHPAVTFRASAVQEVGGYENGPFPEDYDLWLRLVAAGWELRSTDREVVVLRDRPDRLTRTDERYSLEAFREARRRHLRSVLPPCRVVLWGAGRSGKPWVRFFLEERHDLVAVLDIGRATERQGVPVLPPDSLATLEFDRLFVAVGIPKARKEIRSLIKKLRPGLVEGEDWFALA
jgi:glycosyltransferase involved in cell wall biosynthesis